MNDLLRHSLYQLLIFNYANCSHTQIPMWQCVPVKQRHKCHLEEVPHRTGIPLAGNYKLRILDYEISCFFYSPALTIKPKIHHNKVKKKLFSKTKQL